MHVIKFRPPGRHDQRKRPFTRVDGDEEFKAKAYILMKGGDEVGSITYDGDTVRFYIGEGIDVFSIGSEISTGCHTCS